MWLGFAARRACCRHRSPTPSRRSCRRCRRSLTNRSSPAAGTCPPAGSHLQPPSAPGWGSPSPSRCRCPWHRRRRSPSAAPCRHPLCCRCERGSPRSRCSRRRSPTPSTRWCRRCRRNPTNRSPPPAARVPLVGVAPATAVGGTFAATTVTVTVSVSVKPPESVTVNVTVYTPGCRVGVDERARRRGVPVTQIPRVTGDRTTRVRAPRTVEEHRVRSLARRRGRSDQRRRRRVQRRGRRGRRPRRRRRTRPHHQTNAPNRHESATSRLRIAVDPPQEVGTTPWPTWRTFYRTRSAMASAQRDPSTPDPRRGGRSASVAVRVGGGQGRRRGKDLDHRLLGPGCRLAPGSKVDHVAAHHDRGGREPGRRGARRVGEVRESSSDRFGRPVRDRSTGGPNPTATWLPEGEKRAEPWLVHGGAPPVERGSRPPRSTRQLVLSPSTGGRTRSSVDRDRRSAAGAGPSVTSPVRWRSDSLRRRRHGRAQGSWHRRRRVPSRPRSAWWSRGTRSPSPGHRGRRS